MLALYLITSPSSLWTGLYYLPLPTLCHEVGISIEGALKGLHKTATIGFAYYDEATETVWVPEMAKFQVGESLKPGDLKIKGLINDLKSIPKSPFITDFYSRYKASYHLPEEGPWKVLESPLEAPSKGQDVGKGIGIGLGKGSEEGKEGVGEKGVKATASLNGFDAFYSAYPRKKNQGQAEKAWKALKPSEQLQAEILAAIERAKTSAGWLKDAGEFIPYPATWLNAKGWKDEVKQSIGSRPVVREGWKDVKPGEVKL